LSRLREAEDRRGKGAEGLEPLLGALTHGDSVVRGVAVRGLGRQQRADLVPAILPRVDDPAASVRAAALEALAQSMMGPAPDSGSARDARDRLVEHLVFVMRTRSRADSQAVVKASAARSLARLPYGVARAARAAEAALLEIAGDRHAGPDDVAVTASLEQTAGVAHGLYSLARRRRALGDPGEAALAWIRREALDGLIGPVTPAPGPAAPLAERRASIRRLAWLTLAAAGVRNEPRVRTAITDPDAQVRRLVVAYLPNVDDAALRRDVLARARHDDAWFVRVEWVRVYRQLLAPGDCGPLVDATRDPHPHVRLAAIDALAGPCPADGRVSELLRRTVTTGAVSDVPRNAGGLTWHGRAHALVALARADSGAARPLLTRDANHPVWQVRMYVARGATVTGDTAILRRLALDTIGNVSEAALDGLASRSGRADDPLFRRALDSRDYHVVMAGARALRGTPDTAAALAALLTALDRISAEGRETSRDPRMELLARIGELGNPGLRSRLTPRLRDFDSTVSRVSAAILNRWSGPERHTAAPEPPPVEALPLPPPGEWPALRLRVTMSPRSGGGVFVLRLFPDEAPATVARILSLVRQGYYDGLTWHRVVANFVIQGGSPAMNEYVGIGPYMRDEISALEHRRGRVGISTRGRDTGDAQWFVNLVDNYRLDHDYTVFAEVASGLEVVDGIMEGDVIARIEIVR
jgi:cyclophilin family peptidyl-prolyl cis-trans isomerase/HEAT repeat protein